MRDEGWSPGVHFIDSTYIYRNMKQNCSRCGNKTRKRFYRRSEPTRLRLRIFFTCKCGYCQEYTSENKS